MIETRYTRGTTRAAWLLAAGLAVAFVLLLWPASADAQTRALRPKCETPVRTLNVVPQGGSATFTAREPLLDCVTPSTGTSFRVRRTCTFHCQHWHTWVPTGTPKTANVQLKATPTAGTHLVDWSPNCTARLGQARSDCTVAVSTNPTTVTAYLRTTPDTSPPTAPVAGTPTAASYSAVVRWSPSVDDVRVAGYDVIRADTNATVARAGRNATSVTVSKLSCQTPYTFRVEAFDASGNDASSETVQVTTGRCGPTSPPNTSIHTAPPKRTKSRAAFFHFGQKGAVAATKYQCKLDKGRWAKCSGSKGKRYRGLKKGYHTFQVRAGNSVGWDRTPAKHRWRIV